MSFRIFGTESLPRICGYNCSVGCCRSIGTTSICSHHSIGPAHTISLWVYKLPWLFFYWSSIHPGCGVCSPCPVVDVADEAFIVVTAAVAALVLGTVFPVAVFAAAASKEFTAITLGLQASLELRTFSIAGAVALLPLPVLQWTHHFSLEEPRLWDTIDRQEGPVHMGFCGVLEFIAITFAVVAFAIVALVFLAVDVVVFVAFAVAILAVVGIAVATFVVAELGDSSLSSSKGTVLILAGDMDTVCRTKFSLSCASLCVSPSPCAFGWNCCALGLRNLKTLGLSDLEALGLGDVGARALDLEVG